MARMLRGLLIAFAAVAMSGCTCNRNNALTNRFGDVVIVVPSNGTEVLTREGSLTLGPVVMTGTGNATATVRNVGDTSVTLLRVTPLAGSPAFTLTLPEATVIKAQAEVALAISFSPPQDDDATKALVEHRASFQIDASGTRDGEGTLTLELVANAVGRDCLVPALLDFGVVPLNRHSSATLHLVNGSQLPQTPTFGAVQGDDATFFAPSGAAPETIAAGVAADVPFIFTPSAERPYRAQVLLRRSNTCPEARTVLTGSGSNDTIEWYPKLLDFGRVPPGETVARSVTFTNRSSVPATLSALTVNGAWFAGANLTNRTLGPHDSVSVELTCRATAIGQHLGELTLNVDTDPVHALRVPLTCIGGGPRIRLTPTPSIEFGLVPLVQGAPLPSTRRLAIQNVGTVPSGPDDTSSNLFLGQNGKPPFVFIEPANTQTQARDFQVSLLSWDTVKGLPATPGKNTVDLDVHFTPSSVGTKRATLKVYSNDAITPVATVALNADVIQEKLCTLAIEPGSVSFGDLPSGAVLTRTVNLTNTSDNNCLLSGIELAPGSDPVFHPVGAANLLVVARTTGSLNVQVTVPPGSNEGDELTGFLRFSLNSGSTPQVLVPLGVRVSPCLVATPQDLDFGTVKVGCKSASKAVTIYNACSNPILITSLAIDPSPGGFRITAAPVVPAGGLTLAPGVPQPVQVAFVPTDYTAQSGALVIVVSEAGVSKTDRVPMKGVGSTTSTNSDTFTQPAQTPADILFVVDNSCSMFDEQASLAANFSSFIKYANQLKVPYQIGVTTTDDSPLGAQGKLLRTVSNPMVLTPSTPNVEARFSEKVNVGTNGSGIEQPLSAALKAVTSPLTGTANKGFLRAGASLSIVVVSDAPDQSPSPSAYYQNRFLSLVSRQQAWLFTFSTIGPFTSPTPAGCSIDSFVDPGRYAPIIAATSGVQVDICTKDWATDLEKIGKNALGPRSVIYLTSAPDLTQPVTVTVNGTAVTAWAIDPVSNAVVFQDVTTTPPGAMVKVTYQTTCY